MYYIHDFKLIRLCECHKCAFNDYGKISLLDIDEINSMRQFYVLKF